MSDRSALGAPITTLAEAVPRLIRPRDHLHFAATPSRSNAAIREVARAFGGTAPGFTLSTTGFHSTAHLLGVLRLGRRYLGCFFGDVHPVPRPNPLYSELRREGVEFEHWSLLTLLAALRAGALGHSCAVARCAADSGLAEELRRAGRLRTLPDAADRDLVLVGAVRPDVTLVHAALADSRGRVAMLPPYGEGQWSALAARRGVIATVEQVVEPDRLDALAGANLLPDHRVLAVCPEPWGAHPQPLYLPDGLGVPGYRDDFDQYRWWRALPGSPTEGDRFADAVLRGDGSGAGYRDFVGGRRLSALAPPGRAAGPRPAADPASVADPAGASDAETMTVRAARVIADRVRCRGHRVILAGIGQSFLAARLARRHLLDQGVEVSVMVETGLYGVDTGLGGDFLLGHDTMAGAARLTSIEDVLGALACGADNRCLAVIGAAQIDATGAVNSTRLGDGTLLVGSGGAHDLAAAAAEVVVLVRCDRKRMVAAVDYVTSPGRAVTHVVTDRATFQRTGTGTETGIPAGTGIPAETGTGRSWCARDWSADPAADGATAALNGCGWLPAPSAVGPAMPEVTAWELSTLRGLSRSQDNPVPAPEGKVLA